MTHVELNEDAVWSPVTQQVIDTAENLVQIYHPELYNARLGFVFRKEAQKTGAMVALGGVSKISDKLKFFVPYDFIVWISKEDYNQMDGDQRKALIDHQLYHCGKHGNGKYFIRPHNIEEFTPIIERYRNATGVGRWVEQLALMPIVLSNTTGKIEAIQNPLTMDIELARLDNVPEDESDNDDPDDGGNEDNNGDETVS